MTQTTPTSPDIAPARLAGLARWNLGLAVLHAVQAVLVLVLASDFAITVTSSYPTGPPGTDAPAPQPLVDVRVGAAVALFLALAAIDHLLSATLLRDRYERDLRAGINRLRWIEYSVSATVMVLLIASYAGLTDVTTVIAIAGANVGMILFGWLQEAMNPPGRRTTTMLPFWFGTLAGLAPWIAIAVNIAGSATVPGFVYGIFVSLGVFFGSFAVNQWLQYRRIGPWTDYAFGEKGYLVLSLAAKSALAWQIFAGSLAG
jgi:Heliorhodopsin